MKTLLTILMLVCSLWVSGQFSYSIFNDNCGTWQIDSVYLTSWTTDDTLTFNPKACAECWIYSEWDSYSENVTYLVYCPCGCGWDTKRYRNRVNDQGIIQIQYEITVYEYIAPPKSEYEKKIEELTPPIEPVTYDSVNFIRLTPDSILFDTSIYLGSWEVILPPRDVTYESLFHDWSEYTAECYADSTVEYYREFHDMGSTWIMPCNEGDTDALGECPAHVTHRDPDNLPKFMEFLTKKYRK